MCDVKYDQVSTSTRFKRKNVEFADRDLSIPFRLVGSYEYARSLQRFDQLLEISTREQIEIYDQLLAKEPQFSYYAGMYMQPEVANSLDTSIPSDRIQFDERFLRTGVAWMMALAKVELGSTISTYGDQSVRQPFSVFRPNQLDGEACLLVLADDLQAHVKNLKDDRFLARAIATNRKVNNWTFAYLRRSRLMHDMAKALLTSGNRELVSRLGPVEKELNARAKLLVAMIDSVPKWETEINVGNPIRSKGTRRGLIGLHEDCEQIDIDTLTGTEQDRFDAVQK